MGRLWNDRGQLIIVIAIMIPVIFGLVGLAFDVSQVVYKKHMMQSALDLSVLAGVQELYLNSSNGIAVAKDYWQKNGFESECLTVSVNYQGDANKIHAEAAKTVELYFFPILGIRSTEIRAAATAMVEVKPMFNYVLFSAAESGKNAEVSFPGSRNMINGKAHVNQDLKMSGQNNKFNDNLEVVGTMDAHPNNYYKNLIIPSTRVDMVQYDVEKLKSKATIIYQNDVNFSNIELNGIIFVNGKVNISGGKVKGKGTIIATGNINISASRLDYESADDLIAFYSLGDIAISGSDIFVCGTFLAPNGEIAIPGSRNYFYGGIYAKYLRISGSDSHYEYDPRVKGGLNGTSKAVRLVD